MSEIGDVEKRRESRVYEAENVVLADEENSLNPDTLFIGLAKSRLVGKAFSEGDSIQIRIFGHDVTFKVVSTKPSEIVRVTKDTEIGIVQGTVNRDEILYKYNGGLTLISNDKERSTGSASLLIGKKYLEILGEIKLSLLCSHIYDVLPKSGWFFKSVQFRILNSSDVVEFEPTEEQVIYDLSSFQPRAMPFVTAKSVIRKSREQMVSDLKQRLEKLAEEARKVEETKIIVEINTFGDLALGLRKYGYEVTGIYCDLCKASLSITEENRTVSEVVCKYCGTTNRVKDNEKEYQNYLKAFGEGIEKGIKELIDGGKISIKKTTE